MTTPKKTPQACGIGVRGVKERQVLQLKISLLEVTPPVWRRFQILNDATVADLRLAVQIIMGWEDEHLDEFSIGQEQYAVSRAMMGEEPEEQSGNDARRAILEIVLPKRGTPFHYTYDFGDTWEHELVVEQRLPIEPGVTYPRCLEGARACPPEDCGGPWGYADLLEILTDRHHEEREERLEWLGGRFDPEKFSADAANKELRKYFKTPRAKK